MHSCNLRSRKWFTSLYQHLLPQDLWCISLPTSTRLGWLCWGNKLKPSCSHSSGSRATLPRPHEIKHTPVSGSSGCLPKVSPKNVPMLQWIIPQNVGWFWVPDTHMLSPGQMHDSVPPQMLPALPGSPEPTFTAEQQMMTTSTGNKKLFSSLFAAFWFWAQLTV